MSFVRLHAELGGCGCRGKGAGMSGGDGLGATDPTSVTTVGAPAGTNPVVYLKAQLNRYTAAGGAPIAWQIAAQPIPLTTTLDANTAGLALLVLGRRAGAAVRDAVTQQLLSTVGQAWANPVAYVSANLPAVIDVVRLFGDANNLPPPKGVPQVANESLPLLTPTMVIGGLVVAAVLFGKKKRRSSR